MIADAYLMQDGLSEYDLAHMTEIIREGMGDWYHAELVRALYTLVRKADASNMQRLREAYPGTVAAIRLWYNDPTMEGRTAA